MKERPILFSGAMVRALLAGTKTQTRREFKVRGWARAHLRALEFVHVLHGIATRVLSCAQPADTAWAGFKHTWDSTTSLAYFKCPYGQPGDRLWVRESFGYVPTACGSEERVFAADYTDGSDKAAGVRYKPSIHMPRAASRTLLEITAVRVERLQAIDASDAAAEGLLYDSNRIGHWSGDGSEWFTTGRDAYRHLWQQINGPDSWTANPWVWVVEFRKLP